MLKEIDNEIHEWVEVYKRNNTDLMISTKEKSRLNVLTYTARSSDLSKSEEEEFEYLESKYDDNDLPEVWFFELRKELLLDGYSEEEIDKGFDRFHK